MLKQVLINVEETDVRAAVLEDGILVELFVEHLHARSKVGNIVKGRVDGIVPGLKAVFVDVGFEKNAFLHFNDVLAEFELPERGRPERDRRSTARSRSAAQKTDDAPGEDDEFIEPLFAEEGEGGEEGEVRPPVKAKKQKRRPPRPLRVGDEILVQITKEEINGKGARVTNYVSLPGRYLVLMPFSEEGGGVSRRIENVNERRRLRRLLAEIQPGNGSFIIRTAGLLQDEDAIRKDAEALLKNWESIQKRATRCRAPACLHDDQEIIPRIVRDNFSDDIDEILIDSKRVMRELLETCQNVVPRLCDRIHYYDSAINIFDAFEVERQFQKAMRRKVWLKSGGLIAIDETEALTAIDVNSGKFVGDGDQDSVILKTNLEACQVVARELRLRDLGGLVVIDFIDMTSRDHELQVLREFKRCLASDRAKYSISDFSDFGLVEMTRKRVRKSLSSTFFQHCPYCEGSGRILTDGQLWKQLKYDLIADLEKPPKGGLVEILVHSQFKTYLQSTVCDALSELAGKYGVELNIVAREDFHHERIKFIKHAKSMDGDSEQESRPSGPAAPQPAKKNLNPPGSPIIMHRESQPRPG